MKTPLSCPSLENRPESFVRYFRIPCIFNVIWYYWQDCGVDFIILNGCAIWQPRCSTRKRNLVLRSKKSLLDYRYTKSFTSWYATINNRTAFCNTRWMRSSTSVNIKDLFNTPYSTRIKMREGHIFAIVCPAALPSVCFHGQFNFLSLKKESKASKTFPTLKIKWYQTGTAGTAASRHWFRTKILNGLKTVQGNFFKALKTSPLVAWRVPILWTAAFDWK